MFKLKGIKGRWMLNSIAAVIVLVLIAIMTFSLSQSSFYYASIRTALENKAQTAAEFFTSYVTRTYYDYYNSAYRYTEMFEDKDVLELQFVNTRGKIEVSSFGRIGAGYSPGTPDISQALALGEIISWDGDNPATGERILAVSAPIEYSDGSIVGVMRYVTSLKMVDARVVRATMGASVIGLLLIIIVFASNMYFINTITRPIHSLTALAKQIAEGSYGIQAKKQYDDEIGQLTDAINEMSTRISQSERTQAEFISSVSHELRTPLTAITGWSETLMYDPDLTEDSRRGLTIISRETDRLSKMVEELLDFTRLQDGRFTLNVEPVDVQSELEDCLFAYSDLFKQDGLELNYDRPEGEIPLVIGDPARLRQVFLNIIDNAGKHGKQGGGFDVVLKRNGAYVELSVRDYGPGIPADELPSIKKMFYKGSSKERGSGIGLAICDEIVTRHGGQLVISNAEGGGAVVLVRLPIQ
ncbi:MAG: sensor histidine kinase [Oscillospiraceae bacterium]|jgi:signal transduction histidine kinase|nr:sensor histidine kinase [Oscillospiraceae bacterium]